MAQIRVQRGSERVRHGSEGCGVAQTVARLLAERQA
jgi:hypothetical protein